MDKINAYTAFDSLSVMLFLTEKILLDVQLGRLITLTTSVTERTVSGTTAFMTVDLIVIIQCKTVNFSVAAAVGTVSIAATENTVRYEFIASGTGRG